MLPPVSFAALRRSVPIADRGHPIVAGLVLLLNQRQLLRLGRNQRKLVLLDRFLQPVAQVLLRKSRKQLLLRLLVLRHGHLRFKVRRQHFPQHRRRFRQPLDDGRVPAVKGLLRQPGHLVGVGVVVDELAGEGVDDFHLLAADDPVDAEVGRFRLVARLGRRHEGEARLVEPVRRRQALDRVLDAAADGAGGKGGREDLSGALELGLDECCP